MVEIIEHNAINLYLLYTCWLLISICHSNEKLMFFHLFYQMDEAFFKKSILS